MQTNRFITEFRTNALATYEARKTTIQKAQEWIYKHSTIVKSIEIGGMILGVGAVIAFPAVYSTIGVAAVLLAVAGTYLAKVSYLAYKKLEIQTPFKHKMGDHVFKTGEYGAGKLYYQGDIPILELNYEDPHAAGFANGYLTGKNLHTLFQRYEEVRPYRDSATALEVPNTIAEVKKTIPQEYLIELDGIVKGYQKWIDENPAALASPLTLEDLILFHLEPDSIHFHPENIENQTNKLRNNKLPVLGCTFIADKDEEVGMVVARVMDWPSLNVFGRESILNHRKYPKNSQKASTLEVGFPGFAGTLTGLRKGLALGMNVNSNGETTQVRGMPAVFYNRKCLESCATVKEVRAFVKQNLPLGSYHLSVADPYIAKSFHFYQGETTRRPHSTSVLTQEKPLVVTNCTYRKDGSKTNHMHASKERHQIISRFFSEATAKVTKLEKRKLVTNSLKLPYVNNSLSTHSVVMLPKKEEEVDEMHVVFDNAFSSGNKLHKVDTTNFF